MEYKKSGKTNKNGREIKERLTVKSLKVRIYVARLGLPGRVQTANFVRSSLRSRLKRLPKSRRCVLSCAHASEVGRAQKSVAKAASAAAVKPMKPEAPALTVKVPAIQASDAAVQRMS